MSKPESATSEDDPHHGIDERSQSRWQLLWDVFVFQFKLAFDGIRDVVLVPVSIVAGLVGLLVGGNEPARYFRRVLRFGRRTEYWLNLFDHPQRRSGTSDELIDPIRVRVFEEAEKSELLRNVGSGLSRSLDQVGESIAKKQKRSDPPES